MLADLKVKLAALDSAIKNSVATAAAERIAKALARAAEMRVKAEESRERKYLLDALSGTEEEKERRLGEIETAMAEYREICKLLDEARVELSQARKKSASADREQLAAAAQAVVDEVRAEKERIETDPDVAFFGWLRQLEVLAAENPDHRLAISLINGAIANGLLQEIKGEEARARQEATKNAKAAKKEAEEKEGWHPRHDDEEVRQAPFFWIRVKPRGGTPKGEVEPDDHFRYISGGVDFYARTTDSARKRLAFFALQGLWKAVGEAKKTAYQAAQDVKQHSYLTLAEVANGQTGQAWAEVTSANPWKPTFFNREANKVERLVKEGKLVENFGPVVVESPRPGVLRILNAVQSGMFHPLRLAGAWDEDGKPVDFRFFPDNGSFAGLRPAIDDGSLSPGKLGRLRAILCLAGGFQAPTKVIEVNGNGGDAPGPVVGRPHAPATRRGYRADGSKAGEPHKGKGGKRFKGCDDDLED